MTVTTIRYPQPKRPKRTVAPVNDRESPRYNPFQLPPRRLTRVGKG